MPVCKHKDWELYVDETSKGLWGQCSVCDATTAIFTGPPAKAQAQVEAAMKAAKRQKPRDPNKPHKGAGRPKILPDDAKFRAFTLCDSHVSRLDKYKKANDLSSRSEALRHMLENQPA